MRYIEIRDLYFEYKYAVPVLNKLSFSIDKCGIYLILGKNGSGKTTLMKLLVKYLKYKTGSIKLNEKELNDIRLPELSKMLSFLESEIPFIPLSVKEVISWGFYPYKNPGNVHSVAEMLNLTGLLYKNFNELSTGEKKRVLLARVFAQRSKIVLIDEPFNFLDPYYKIEIALMLKRLSLDRVVLISTHNLNAAQFIGEKIFLLNKGSIAGVKTKDSLFSDDDIIRIFSVPENLKSDFKLFYRIKGS
jgi:iron complex transport system ATP-binding protein